MKAFEEEQAALSPTTRWPMETTVQLNWSGGSGDVVIRMQRGGGNCRREVAQLIMQAVAAGARAGAREWYKTLLRVFEGRPAGKERRNCCRRRSWLGGAALETNRWHRQQPSAPTTPSGGPPSGDGP